MSSSPSSPYPRATIAAELLTCRLRQPTLTIHAKHLGTPNSSMAATSYVRPAPYRSAAPPRSAGPPHDEPLPALPPQLALDDNSGESKFEPCWALDAIRYSTILGAYTLTSADLKLLRKVPRGGCEDDVHDRRITRTQSQIMSGHRQRIDFGFCSGGRLKHRGMPMYALANATEQELYRNMSASGDTVMKPFLLRQIRVRFLVRLPPRQVSSRVRVLISLCCSGHYPMARNRRTKLTMSGFKSCLRTPVSSSPWLWRGYSTGS